MAASSRWASSTWPGDDRREAVGPVGAQHHPQLERPEPPPQRDAVVHQVDRILVVGAQVLRDDREGRPQVVGARRVEDAAVHRRQEPLVRVHEQRIGPLATVQHVAQRRGDGGRASVGGVDMQPHAVLGAHVGGGGHGVDARGRGGADGGDHGDRPPARAHVGGHRLAQRIGPHPVLGVGLDLHEPVTPEAEHDAGLLDRRVRLGGGVHAQRRQVVAPGHAARADVEPGRLPGGGEGVQRRRRGAVGDLAEPVRSAGPSARPAIAASPARARWPPARCATASRSRSARR